jgi:hypothetical protein
VGRAGLEPAKAEPADLQSAPFAARDTDPCKRMCRTLSRAGSLDEHEPRYARLHPGEPTMGLEPITY